ncbi:MAG: hypothetical protein ACRYG8_46310 [Janthinobacterium lividum]
MGNTDRIVWPRVIRLEPNTTHTAAGVSLASMVDVPASTILGPYLSVGAHLVRLAF